MSERDITSRAEELERRLRGTRALVVGANGAIGAGVAAALAKAGCLVASSDLQPEAVSTGDRRPYFKADLTDDRAAEELLRWVSDRLGGVDVVVNSAGIGHADPLESLPIETWRKVFAVNVEAALQLSQVSVRQMSAQEISAQSQRRGLIIHITSGAAEVGRPLAAAYGASKAALNHLCKSLAATFEDRSISTAAVSPGAVEAGMLRYLMPGLERVAGSDVATSARGYSSKARTCRRWPVPDPSGC